MANTPVGAIAFQWHTKLKHMVDLPLTYVIGILVIDKKILDGLSAEDQKAVNEELAAAFGRIEKATRDDNTQARAALQKQGVVIFVPNADESRSWDVVGETARKELITAGEITPEMSSALNKALTSARGPVK